MNVPRAIAACAACLAAGAGDARPADAAGAERERNAWPAVVRQLDAGGATRTWTAVGPLAFRQDDVDGGTARGLRPLWVQRHDARGEFRAGHFLYPLFSYTVDENTYKWSVFELIRRTDRRPSATPPRSVFEQNGEFEIFPFWFSRETGDGELSYKALFPVHGTVKNKLGFERLSWTLFPLYVANEKRGAVTTFTPWPFIRVTRGAARGGGVWPLFHYVDRPGVSRDEFYLWPLGFNRTRLPSPDDPPGTPARRDVGLLPFYARSTGPGYIDENYLWPFFGYTDRAAPPAAATKKPAGLMGMFDRAPPGRYHETRYFWPLLVQGRGEEKFVNRWAPFYTHSIHKGYDKTWYAWPLVRRARWDDEGIARERTQFLYFLYWSETQRAAGRAHSPAARLTHVWPLYSAWDNGAGRRQLQIFSPLEVFFPGNEKARLAWTPLFAIARHERSAPGISRTSLLWDAVTWQRNAAEERKEFHLGPLFSVAERADEKRVAIGNGLFGFKRAAAGTRWRMFWWDFAHKNASVPSSSAKMNPRRRRRLSVGANLFATRSASRSQKNLLPPPIPPQPFPPASR